MKKKKIYIIILCILILGGVFMFFFFKEDSFFSRNGSIEYDGVYPYHEPLGMGVGVNPGRVSWIHDQKSVSWDGNGYWWDLNHFDEKRILAMVNDAVS